MRNIHGYTREEFEALKTRFHNMTYHKFIDPESCALYYGLWWKFAYTGGAPSKDMVFESLNIRSRIFTSEDFYQKAKQGGRKIRLKWIQLENTLYFKTLLLQGGIPLQYLKTNQAAIRKFLLKVIEQHPKNTIEIADSYEVIKDLPISTRNDVVYEAALNISNAIWENTDEGKEILNLLEQYEFQNLVHELRGHKEQVASKAKSSIKINAFWELTKSDLNNALIKLKFDLPVKLEKIPFVSMIGINLQDLMQYYNLFCDQDILSTYRKNINGDYINFLSPTKEILWNPEIQQLPEIYFLDASGEKYVIPLQVKRVPSESIPSLWVQMEENRWIMSEKNNHNGENAFVLTSSLNACPNNYFDLNIANKSMYFYEITESTTVLINGLESITFKLNSTSSFDWSINSNKPPWMSHPNMVVVTSLPSITFYSESRSIIPSAQISKKWRKKGSFVWKDLNGEIPEGIIQLQFGYNDEMEYDKVFNIGNFTLSFSSQNILNYRIRIDNNPIELTVIPKNPLITIKEDLYNSLNINYTNPDHLNSQLKGYLNSSNGLLSFDLILPIKGVFVLDKEYAVVPDNNVLLLNNIHGYRIICGENQTLKLYNEQIPDLVIHQNLKAGVIPLHNYNTIIQKLFLLADAMSATNVVALDIDKKTIKFKNFNTTLTYLSEDGYLNKQTDGRVLFQLCNISIDNIPPSNYILYAVPLNCELNHIIPIELERTEVGFCFPSDVIDQEFIVFDTRSEINCKILPTYVSIDQDNIIFPLDSGLLKQRKLNRIEKFSGLLSQEEFEGPEWLKLNRYIQICTQFNIPFSAFDNIRASTTSSDLAARLLFILILYSKSDEEFVQIFVKMEEDLGFRFQWCAFQSFEAAFNNVIEKYGSEIISSILQRAILVIERKFLMWERNSLNLPDGFHLRTEISKMRARLGPAVISELPEKYPYISWERKNIIDTSHIDIRKIDIMAFCPIAIGLIKLNIYTQELPKNTLMIDIWHMNNNIVRRNIMYCENLDPLWYDLALKHTLIKLTTH